MAKVTASQKIPDLGEKIDFLAGILGHKRLLADFRPGRLSEVMNTDETQVSHKRCGRVAVYNSELGALIDFFRLGPEFDFEVFHLSLDEFKLAMREARIGTYAGPSDSVARAELLSISRSSTRLNPKNSKLSLKLRKVGEQRRAGGLGYADLSTRLSPAFKLGELVVIDTNIPCRGHLVVLNDQLDLETTCLVPSMFSETTAVAPGRLCLPTSDDYRHFEIIAPIGDVRLYAIWTPVQPMLPWADQGVYPGEPVTLNNLHLVEYVRMLPKEDVEVAVLDYRVIG